MPFAVSRRFAAHIAAIPAEEIARQYRLLTESGATRRVLTFFIYIMAAFLSPLPVALLCCLLDFAAEWFGARQMKGLIPASQPRRYLATLVALVVSQASFTTMLGFVYQSPAPLAAPFAAGVLTLTMLQLASIRVIHLPYAVTGLATTFCVALGAVVWNWPSRSGPAGLALTLLSLMAAAYFIHSVVRANHALHAGIAQEREAARLADLAKSRFLAQMSHELRTPLNAILGLGHAEMMQARDPEAVERMRLVTEAARGLAVILDDILDMAAIEAGHLPIRPVICDPAREIAAAAELYRPLFEAQGLAVRLEISPAFPAHVVLDSQRLRQCLSNLFSNALKHTAHGGVTLEARLAEATGAQGRIEIRVSDTGPGIPPDETERIFQPFQRGTSSQPGTGLGLSITRALARSMGGDLVLVPGSEGAQFLMTLAFATPQAGPARPALRCPGPHCPGPRCPVLCCPVPPRPNRPRADRR
ncbi:sensor histidine kinase [Tabrizicola oligotrophica]|uniref:histidine kinase n=1 Tax=Tabrizicola oligotrophica TaxID=2710650 RepID=A0A6M0QPN7_9RHOB|nr:HAMP domain-containing sensor histidine kinase [Tabrizicola oligotrophica]NEY89435.1 HAMP domain-containing histidine kinase [Tabrizicola oligotrophica]